MLTSQLADRCGSCNSDLLLEHSRLALACCSCICTFLSFGFVLCATACGNEVSDLLAIFLGSDAVWTLMTQRSELTTSMLVCASVLSNDLVGIVASVTVNGTVTFLETHEENYCGRDFQFPVLIPG